ncbi:MAG TPA: SpoIIE family protein phosphatase [Mycobacteriales bacterium]
MGRSDVTGGPEAGGNGPRAAVPEPLESVATPPDGDLARLAATRGFIPEVAGNAGLDRLADLAARLVGAGSARVSLRGDAARTADGEVADPLDAVTAALGLPLVVADARVDARVADLDPVASGAVGSYLGVPLVDPDGRTLGVLGVFDPEPHDWSDADTTLLGQLAAAAVTQLELSALAAEYATLTLRLELAMEAGGVGSFDWNLRTGRLTWDDRLAGLFGYETAADVDSIAGFNARVHPDDLPQVNRAVQDSIDTGSEFRDEYRVVLPGGETRWITARGRALTDENGVAVRLLGAAYDTTAVRDGETRTTRVLERMSAAFFSLDPEWRFTYVNAEAERLLGLAREELLGGSIWELFPAALDGPIEDMYRGAMRTGEPSLFEAYYPVPLDAWYEVRAWPGPDGLAVYFLDITERRRAREEAERSAARLDLLARVSAAFAAELDPEPAVTRLAQLMVPALADWCLATVVDDDNRLRDVGWWHHDPELRPVTERYARLRVGALLDTSYVSQALRTGKPAIVEQGATAAITAVLAPGDAQATLAELAPDSAAVFALRARGRTVGVLSLFNGPDRGRLDARDLDTAEDVAARAGLGLDNALLYRRQQRIAEGLQRSLLTEPPRLDELQTVVRYVPAAKAAQVGGDWYDAFRQADGATVLAIGDVVGHDTAAAAAMGQLRGLLRGIAFTTQDPPARVLTRLDEAIQGLQLATIATAVVARIEPGPDRGALLRWSNAGHPPPMLLRPDGTVTVLAASRPNLLLGIDPATARIESEVALEPGSTVLLYTDGLVERRGHAVNDGLDRLRRTLVELADRPLDELCDEVLARMLPPEPQDDVAIVAVRVRPGTA